MLDPQQSQYIDLLQDPGTPKLTDQQKEFFYNEILQRSRDNPDFGKESDAKVASNATRQGYSPESVVKMLSSGPYLKGQVEEDADGITKSTVPKMMTEHLRPIAKSLYQVEARKALLDSLNQSQQQQRSPLQTSALFLSTGYSILKGAEQTFFAVTPLPMNAIKSGIQNVAFPLGIAAVASQNPLVGNIINSVGDFAGAVARSATNGGLGAMGSQFMSVMPKGMGIHSTLGVVGSGISYVSGNLSQAVGATLGKTGAAIAVGKAVVEATKGIYQNRDNIFRTITNPETVSSLTGNIEQAIVSAQSAIDSAKTFASVQIESLKQNLLNIPKEKFMSTENQQPEQQSSFTVSETLNSLETRRLNADSNFVELQRNDGNASWKVENGNLTPVDNLKVSMGNIESISKVYELPVDSLQPGDRVLDKLQVVSPAKVELQDSGNFTVIQRGKLQVREQQISNDGQTQVQRQETVVQQPIVVPPTPPIVPPQDQDSMQRQQEINAQQNGNLASPEQELTPSEQIEAAKRMSGKSESPEQEEFRGFALDLKNQLAQRGINTENFQIDYNGQNVFKSLENGNNLKNDSMSKEAHDALKQIQTDYTNFKGEVKITAGGKTLLHVKNGELLHDAIGMAKTNAKVEVKSADNSLYTQASKNVTAEGPKRLEQIAQNAFATGASTDEVKKALKMDPAYEQQSKNCNPEQAEALLSAVASAGQLSYAKSVVAQSQQEQSQQHKKEPAMSK